MTPERMGRWVTGTLRNERDGRHTFTAAGKFCTEVKGSRCITMTRPSRLENQSLHETLQIPNPHHNIA